MRNRCTKENPMPKDAPGQWEHEGAKFVRENYDGDIDYYRCVDCGQEWRVDYKEN
jgi:hypothetical protein